MKHFGRRINLELLFIILIAALLRLPAIRIFPTGFTPDEASFAYDAYSILHTGRDQWGHFLPLTLESFGDFKMPLLGYLTIPFVYLLGLTKEAVRLPNALIGVAAVIAAYYCAGQIGIYSGLSKNALRLFKFFTAFFLAISPWHIMMSRGGFEANLTTFFLTAGILFFFKGIKDNHSLILSAAFFGLNLFSYHAARLITPMVVAVLCLLYIKELKTKKIIDLFNPLYVFIIFLGISLYTLTQGSLGRVEGISVLGGAANAAAQGRLEAINQGIPEIVAKVLHNKYTIAFSRSFTNYQEYFSFRFLFMDGPSETTYGMIPGRGVLYLFDLPLLIIGLFSIFRMKTKRPLIFILIWLIISPLPASLAMGQGYSANRAEIMLPAFQFLTGLGALYVFLSLQRRQSYVKNTLIIISGLVILLPLVLFCLNYFGQSPLKSAKGMLSGNLELARLLKEKYYSYDSIVVSRNLSEPHIYIAFAEKYDPDLYQYQTKNWQYSAWGVNWVDQIPVYRLGRYVFKQINWEEDSETAFLIAGKPEEFPTNIIPQSVVYYPNGEPAIYVVDPHRKVYAKL